MSQIIPPPIKIEFPEAIVLSSQISGTRTGVAATEKAVGTVNTKVNELKEAVTQLQNQPKIYGGANDPSNSLGRDGDIYFHTGG
ncbi:hypothetical protein ACRZ5S_14560 [Vibrio scophthalmi]|uniref:Uncharacterized protein n=1 Tax=Vibrio scophthalmi TaxID=45658 RepID=A0A1E3WKS3_9VIBR|nr:hypothetical protein [Vibrio scophthalmi]ODS10097.1 hypothetical protein VSF3289_00335 [Vibrio scophthalmi]